MKRVYPMVQVQVKWEKIRKYVPGNIQRIPWYGVKTAIVKGTVLTMNIILPRRILGSKAELSDQLTVSILIDRTLTLEIGKGVLVILSTEEAAALREYLQRHSAKFHRIGGQA